MRILIVVMFLILNTRVYSQEFADKKSIMIEAGGTAGLGSINYENIFTQKGDFNLFWRLGFSALPIDKNNGLTLIIPATFGVITGKTNHKFEMGIGQGVSITTRGKLFALTTPSVGYRFHNASKPFFFRLTYTPLISYIFDFQYQHWGGISLGYQLNFKK